LLKTYPQLPFILIGDSGEKDPEYYQEIVKQFPNRILAVYIREVKSKKRIKEVRKIVKEVKALGVPMLLMEDSFAAAAHSEAMGWLDSEAMELVREAVWQ
jgi:phosphatidate phosphatase APP1